MLRVWAFTLLMGACLLLAGVLLGTHLQSLVLLLVGAANVLGYYEGRTFKKPQP